MLFLNAILVYPGAGTEKAQRLRLLWLHPSNRVWFVIDIDDPGAFPSIRESEELSDDVLQGRALLLKPEEDPFLPITSMTTPSDSQVRGRDAAWNSIATIVVMLPEIFHPQRRSREITLHIESNGGSKQAIYDNLRRYWQRGQVKNALLPDFPNCGAKGKERNYTEGIKRGRPRKYGTEIGINVTKMTRKIFAVAVGVYTSENGFTVKGVYDDMVARFFTRRAKNEETGRSESVGRKINAQTGEWLRPTIDQFKYWFYREIDRFEMKRRRVGAKIYDKDMRGYIGTATQGVWGPGARYAIDATIADIYVVSRLNRKKIIGRPVLYVVIDVFSRMIVGIYIGLEGPSWVGAMMALANTATEKVGYCAQYGVDISPEDWPCRHLCTFLLGDRGELESEKVEMLQAMFGVIVENTAPYRADWKGVVETRFRLLPAKFKPYAPGYVKKDFRARGGSDYRLDATLDLDQFTKIIIGCVLYFNNHHELKDYDADRGVVEDEVLPVPCDLWEWGIANRSGQLRQYPEDLVKFALMPTGSASVTKEGILFRGQHYTCERAMVEHWFDRARQDGRWSVKVSYDSRCMDRIYLHRNDERKFDVCNLTPRSRAFLGLSEWEIGEQSESAKNASANHRANQQLADSALVTLIDETIADAQAQAGPASTESNRARVVQIRTNRAEEKQERRSDEVFTPSDGTAHPVVPLAKRSPSDGGEVLPFPSSAPQDDAEPSILEIMKIGVSK
jgi:hypothetical protein